MIKTARGIDPMKQVGKLAAVGFAYEKDGAVIVSNVWQNEKPFAGSVKKGA